MTKPFDFAVIGAGIAGASVAAELSREATVLLLEMESQPGYHATGRSAALYAPGYGPQPIRALTRASAAFYKAPPAGFSDVPLLSPRDVVMVARADQSAEFDAFVDSLAGDAPKEERDEILDAAAVKQHVPLLRDGYADQGHLDRTGSDIDVDALHQGYLRAFRANGGTMVTKAEVTALTREAGLWRVETATDKYQAAVVINAAGAWAEQVGALAGAETIGLVPKRRTALVVAAPAGVDVAKLPMVVDIVEEFYLKPDAGRLLISPANEDPMDPCDAQPDELDIAYCIDRIERAFDLQVRRIENRWAGLRSFVADKSPVVGYSDRVEGFFWLAGQGGYGIQSAPALARTAAALALRQPVPEDVLAARLRRETIAPQRLFSGG